MEKLILDELKKIHKALEWIATELTRKNEREERYGLVEPDREINYES